MPATAVRFFLPQAIIHVGFDDPPHLAASCRTDEEKTACYRRVRDEIRSFVENLPDNLAKLSH